MNKRVAWSKSISNQLPVSMTSQAVEMGAVHEQEAAYGLVQPMANPAAAADDDMYGEVAQIGFATSAGGEDGRRRQSSHVAVELCVSRFQTLPALCMVE
jgi:hypothetical protein